MARAYQESHILDNLTSSVKALQSQTTELSKAKGLHEERITNLQKQNAEQAKKIEALETRMSANEHNTAARIQNSHAYHTANLHSPLTPLHDLSTDRPIRHFPKHERDVRTMAVGEVIQILQALDVKSMGMSAGEKKAELRAQLGLPRDPDTQGKTEVVAGKKDVPTKVETNGVDGKIIPPQKSYPKVAPGSTAEKIGKTGTAAAKGVSNPVGKGEGKNP